MLTKLRDGKETKGVALKWQSVCTGVSVIGNRVTPYHRDNKGGYQLYDLLANYFEGGSPPRFLVSDLGLDLNYPSGTVIGLCGKILEHGVKAWCRGERVCYAHFMREEVRERLKVPPATWSSRSFYEEYIIPPG
jgi:hypothetical protein